ncbi:MAG: hypothetical protein HY056_16900 [Proteobacteria bacterium]|nr:hypothetical protein [Pseudomonadota bacterium]
MNESKWSRSIHLVADRLTVRYAIQNSVFVGIAEIWGNARVFDIGVTDSSERSEFVEMIIYGKTFLEAKSDATVWPEKFNELPANSIGLSTKAEGDGTRFYFFIGKTSFGEIANLLNSQSNILISLYAEPGSSDTYFVERLDVSATIERERDV